MSMEELVLKMLFCLAAALLIGFLFGWLITRASSKGRYTAEIDEINNEIIDKNVEVDNLSRELSNHQELKKNLLSDLEIKDTELSGLHDVVGRQKNDLLAVKSDLDLKDKKVQELEKVIPSFESKVATLEDAYSAKNSKVAELEEAYHTKSSKVAELEEAYHVKTSKITELEEDYSNLRSEIGSLQLEQDKKHEEIQKLINDKNSYAVKVKELEDVVNQKNIASLELDQKVKEIDVYARENTQLKDNLNHLNSKLDSFQSELNEKDRKLNEVQNQLQERETKLSSYQNELQDKNIDQNALSDLNIKNSRLEDEIRAAKEEAQSYKNLLAKSESRVQELHTSVKSAPTFNHEPTQTQTTLTSKPHLNADLESDEGGFSFIKLAKDTISKLTDSGEDIIKRGDDAIDHYKNKKS